MSKQQGTDIPEVVERNKGKSKKRHGKYQLWMRGKHGMLGSNRVPQWHKIRSYVTMELAEQNLQMCDRKWNALGDSWEFEIRIEDVK
jgi:hypothetical protein